MIFENTFFVIDHFTKKNLAAARCNRATTLVEFTLRKLRFGEGGAPFKSLNFILKSQDDDDTKSSKSPHIIYLSHPSSE